MVRPLGQNISKPVCPSKGVQGRQCWTADRPGGSSLMRVSRWDTVALIAEGVNAGYNRMVSERSVVWSAWDWKVGRETKILIWEWKLDHGAMEDGIGPMNRVLHRVCFTNLVSWMHHGKKAGRQNSVSYYSISLTSLTGSMEQMCRKQHAGMMFESVGCASAFDLQLRFCCSRGSTWVRLSSAECCVKPRCFVVLWCGCDKSLVWAGWTSRAEVKQTGDLSCQHNPMYSGQGRGRLEISRNVEMRKSNTTTFVSVIQTRLQSKQPGQQTWCRKVFSVDGKLLLKSDSFYLPVLSTRAVTNLTSTETL